MECKVIFVENIETEYNLKIYRLEVTNEYFNNANKANEL